MIVYLVAQFPAGKCGLSNPIQLAETREEADAVCQELGAESGYTPMEFPHADNQEIDASGWPKCSCCGGLRRFMPATREYVGPEDVRTHERDLPAVEDFERRRTT